MTRPSVAVLLTSYNRREQTLTCLRALSSQEGRGEEFDVRTYLVDASSPDGTVDAVRAEFPDVLVTTATDDTFWGGGMRRAASAAGDAHDFQLWLNDDVTLDPHAISSLLLAARDLPNGAIVVGAVRDPQGFVSYSGLHRDGRRLAFDRVPPGEAPVRVDTFNGNLVLVPREVAQRLGGIDPAMPHAMGDIDYGLRAEAYGVPSYVAPGVHGTCVRNEDPAVKPRTAGSARARLAHAAHVKRLPPRAWWTFCSRHAGPLRGVVYFAAPYVRAVLGRAPQ